MRTQLLLADVYCTACDGYAHPFLDRCPNCGVARPSHFAKALADNPSEPAITDDPRFAHITAEASTKLAIFAARTGVLGDMGSEGAGGFGVKVALVRPALADFADRIASQLTYRGAGFDQPPLDVGLRVLAGLVTFQDREGRPLAEVDPALVVGAVALDARVRTGVPPGDGFEGPATPPLLDGHRLVISWREAEGQRRVAVGNRPGFFTSRARLGHYADLAWWIGALGAVSAQSRWRSIGANAHAAELGLAPSSWKLAS